MESPSTSEIFDIQYFTQLTATAEETEDLPTRCAILNESFIYLLRFPNLVNEDPAFIVTVRQKCRKFHHSVNDCVATELISFEEGSTLIQVADKLLDITSVISEFDFDELDASDESDNNSCLIL